MHIRVVEGSGVDSAGCVVLLTCMESVVGGCNCLFGANICLSFDLF